MGVGGVGWKWVGVGGSGWGWVGVGGSGCEWVGERFSITLLRVKLNSVRF